MPKFLDDLKAADWIKLLGVTAIGIMLYSDVQSSLKSHAEKNAQQDIKIVDVERKIAEALVKQGQVTEKMAETLSLMNGSLRAIEAQNGQLDKRIERIERKL